MGALMILLLDGDLDAAVLLAAFGVVGTVGVGVGGDGFGFAEAFGGDHFFRDAFLFHEPVFDGVGTALGHFEIDLVAAFGVAVAFDGDFAFGEFTEDGGDGFEELFGSGQDGGFVELEEDIAFEFHGEGGGGFFDLERFACGGDFEDFPLEGELLLIEVVDLFLEREFLFLEIEAFALEGDLRWGGLCGGGEGEEAQEKKALE